LACNQSQTWVILVRTELTFQVAIFIELFFKNPEDDLHKMLLILQCFVLKPKQLRFCPAILIIKIGFLKTRRWRVFKKPILVFSAPSALETPKSVS